MQTTRQKFEQMLFECGLFERQATEIMDMAIPEVAALDKQYRVTWDRPASEYLEPFYTVLFNICIKKVALQWLEKNFPDAWNKALFQ